MKRPAGSDDEYEEAGLHWRRPKTVPASLRMVLELHAPNDRVVTLTVDPWTTGAEVHAMVFHRTGVPINRMEIRIGDVLVEMHRMISHYTNSQLTRGTLRFGAHADMEHEGGEHHGGDHEDDREHEEHESHHEDGDPEDVHGDDDDHEEGDADEEHEESPQMDDGWFP